MFIAKEEGAWAMDGKQLEKERAEPPISWVGLPDILDFGLSQPGGR